MVPPSFADAVKGTMHRLEQAVGKETQVKARAEEYSLKARLTATMHYR